MTENAVKKAIIDYLVFNHFLVIRVNSGAVVGQHQGKRRFVRFVKWFALGQGETSTGISDILAVGKGIILAIEAKSPDRPNNVSEAQRQFMAEWRAHGGVAVVASSINDVIAALEAANVRPMV